MSSVGGSRRRCVVCRTCMECGLDGAMIFSLHRYSFDWHLLRMRGSGDYRGETGPGLEDGELPVYAAQVPYARYQHPVGDREHYPSSRSHTPVAHRW